MDKNENIAFLKKMLSRFISYKRLQGYKYRSEEESLVRFIKFVESFGLTENRLSKELVLEYSAKRLHETPRNHANRVSDLKQFVLYLNENGYPAHIPSAGKYLSSFVPYIFTHDEISRIFQAVDRLKPNKRYNSAIAYPVLFRVLYGCGLRISEALNLKVGDVDLKKGVLTIKKSKYEKDRLVPMSESVNSICRRFYRKVHKNSSEDDYFFKNRDGSRRNQSTVYDRFREILWESGIPYCGKGKGPRLHDLRYPNLNKIQTFLKDAQYLRISIKKGLDFILYFFTGLTPQNSASPPFILFHFFDTFLSFSSSSV